MSAAAKTVMALALLLSGCATGVRLPPDEEVLAWVGDRPVLESELQAAVERRSDEPYDWVYPQELRGHIQRELKRWYMAKHGLVVSEAARVEAIDIFCRSFGGLETPDDECTEFANRHVELWVFQRAIYEQYGGTVVWQQFNPQEPVGAYRALVRDAEESGVLRYRDQGVRALFVGRPGVDRFVIDPADVSFEEPWWRGLTVPESMRELIDEAQARREDQRQDGQ